MFLLFNVVSRCRMFRMFSLMLFHVSVLRIRMFLLFNVVYRVGVTDPDVDVSSLYVVSRVGVTDPDVDVSSL